MEKILGSIGVTIAGVLVALFIPGEYNGHSFALVGWIIASGGLISAIVTFSLVIRQQNTEKKIYSSMLASNKTRVFMGDGRDHVQSDDMIDRR